MTEHTRASLEEQLQRSASRLFALALSHAVGAIGAATRVHTHGTYSRPWRATAGSGTVLPTMHAYSAEVALSIMQRVSKRTVLKLVQHQ